MIGGTIIFDSKIAAVQGGDSKYKWIDLPMLETAKNLGSPLLVNTVGVGAILKLVGMKTDVTSQILKFST